MDKQQRSVRVTRTTEQRSPRNVRRLGQALIALAQAQLEAEAQAEADGKIISSGKSGNKKPPGEKPSRPTGDAA